MKTIELILEFETEPELLRRISAEHQVSVGAVLQEAVLRGLAHLEVHGYKPISKIPDVVKVFSSDFPKIPDDGRPGR